MESKMDFSQILYRLKMGSAAERNGWNGKGMFIKAQYPDNGSKNTLPYLWLWTVDGKRVPWLASQTDLFAEDWREVEGK